MYRSLLLFHAALAFSCVRAFSGLIVDTTEINRELAPGGEEVREMMVSVTDGTPVDVSVFVSDWDQKPDGSVEALKPGSLPFSATPWVSVHPQRFTVTKGHSQKVAVKISVPKAQLEGAQYRSMVFTEMSSVEKKPSDSAGRALQINVLSRIGTKVFLALPGKGSIDAEVKNISLENRDGHPGLTVTVANTGSLFVKTESSHIELKDAKGSPVTVPMPPFSVLPGHERVIFCPLPDTLKQSTRYHAMVVVDFNTTDLIAGELDFTY